MMRIEEHHTPWDGQSTTSTYTVTDTRGNGSVNFRSGTLWRADNRYPGDWMVRRQEQGLAELTIIGSGGKEQKFVFSPGDEDRLILSLLEIRDPRQQLDKRLGKA